MLTKKTTATETDKQYRLVNFVVVCTCGKEYKFTSLNMTKVCNYYREVKLSEKLNQKLIRNRGNN